MRKQFTCAFCTGCLATATPSPSRRPRNSCDVGQQVGERIADYVMDNYMRPLERGRREHSVDRD